MPCGQNTQTSVSTEIFRGFDRLIVAKLGRPEEPLLFVRVACDGLFRSPLRGSGQQFGDLMQ